MLDLSGFQIFYMVLHGAVIFFVLAFLVRGNERRQKQKVVDYNNYRHKNLRKRARQATPQTVSQSQTQYREVYEAAEGQDFCAQTAPGVRHFAALQLVAITRDTVDGYEVTETEKVIDLFDD